MARQKQSEQAEWNAADYLQRKRERRDKVAPQWFTNPETGERFYVRPIGAMAFVVAGHMQHLLTEDAVDGWQKNGVGIPIEDDEDHEELSEQEELAKLIKKGEEHAEVMARVIKEACVIPRIVLNPELPGDLHIVDMEQSDMFFVFRAATGQASPESATVTLKGGESTTVATIKSVSKRSGKGSRTLGRG